MHYLGVLNCVFVIVLYFTSNLCCVTGSGALNQYPKIKQYPIQGISSSTKPLILTPLLDAGKIKEARSASRVSPLYGDHGVESYSGFFTVNKQFKSNLFVWFFKSQTSFAGDPMVLWLQGGPGATSLYGLFEEHGPFIVDKTSSRLLPRKYTWIRNLNVLYIDNPVGTGFSFTQDGYAQNETAVGNDIYTALVQFFKLFPELQKNEFFVTGESYAGKYVPAVSYTIHTRNLNSLMKINLKGLAIGNGLCDPVHMLKYSDYLYQLGLIDYKLQDILHKEENLGRMYIQNNEWMKAYFTFEDIFSIFHNQTGFSYNYNYLYSQGEELGGDFVAYVQQPQVREAIHVGNSVFHGSDLVEGHLRKDFMQSVKPWVEQLLEHYRVLIYNGQLDIIVAYPLTVSFLQQLQWSGTEEYRAAPRFPWHVGKDIAGYVKTAGNLTELLVRNAGHLVPADQPRWSLDLINRFTANKPFHCIKC